MGARHWNVEQFASQDIGCAVKATKIGIFGGREPSVRSLGASQAKLVELHFWSGCNTKPGRVGGHQTGKVDQVEKNGLTQLDEHKRPTDHDEGHPWKADRALWNCRYVQLGWLERGEVGEELLLAPRELPPQVGQVGVCKLEAVEEGKTLRQSGKYSELPLEWILSEEKVECRIFFSISSLQKCKLLELQYIHPPSSRHMPYAAGRGQ